MPMSSAETSSETSSQTNTEAELTPVPFEQVCPILRVRDVSASIDYYFASVSRGKSHVKGIRDKQAPGFGSASKTRMLCYRNTAAAEREFGTLPQTTPGPTRCR